MTNQVRASWAARARQWLAGRTLRSRLVVGLLGLLALACATVGVVTYTHLHTVLVSQLNTELKTANFRYTGCFVPAGPPGDGDSDDPHPPALCAQQQATAAFTAVVLRDGEVSYPYLAGRTGVCRLTAQDQAAIARVRVGAPPRTVELTAYGSYQMVASHTSEGIVVTGLPLSTVSHTLHQVAAAELAVFLAALLITGVIGTAWVRVSLRPLRRVAATAARTQLPLGSGEVSLPERVPDANPAPRSAGRCRIQPHARPRRGRARPPRGQRVAAAQLRRRRKPRAADPARGNPRVRRTGQGDIPARCRTTSRTH